MSYLRQLRARVGSRKVIVCYATALIRDTRGHVLFQQRGDFDWWGLPGGVLELGETLAECCVREAREETGLIVEPIKLVGVYTGPQYEVRYPNGDEVQQWTAAFECRIVSGEPQPDGAESRAQAFFPPDALPATSRWYAAMARDLFAEREAATFEPPRVTAPDGHGRYVMNLRAAFGQEWMIAPGASAIIRNEAGAILFVRRADNGRWMIPSGYQDLGESIAETVVREVREELGLIVEPARLVSVTSGAKHRVIYSNGDPVQLCSATFECRLLGGILTLDHSEITEAGYFSPAALPDTLSDSSRIRIALALQTTSSHTHFA
jgi:ADP-ribose pyrophosphatase YjhB (NUDIX family)